MRDRFAAADVERAAVAGVALSRQQKRLDRIVHVNEIADLRAVAEDLDLLVFEGEADEPGDESLAVVFQQLPRTVDVGQPQPCRRTPKTLL